jgi:2-dehydro-3-deoxygluconokinase
VISIKKDYSMQAFDVITYGEAMAMFVADETGDLSTVNHFTRRLSGAETNVAIGLSRLGLRVGWVSRTGADAFGRYVRAQVASEGIDCSQVRIDPRFPTGFQLKSKAENGEDPLIEYFRKGSAASHLSLGDDFDADYFLAARHLHATGVAAALSDSSNAFAHHALDFMRANGKTVSFDPNLRPTLWPSEQVMVEQINRLAVKANWVLPGLNEGRILTGYSRPEEIAAFYLDQGVDKVIVKLGPDGAYFRTAAGETGVVAAVRVDTVIDTVGAGDGFAAGVISALLEGLPLKQAVVRGNHIGAFAIQVVGDMEGFPTRAQLDAAIQAS